jgi:DNA topoisomerase-2
MMLFDAEGKIKRYDSPEEILQEFFDLRLAYYEKRRVALLQVCLLRHLSCVVGCLVLGWVRGRGVL